MKTKSINHNHYKQSEPLKSKLPETIVTAADHLIDLPAGSGLNRTEEMPIKKQPKIKVLKMSYPKNGLAGLL